MKSIKKKIAVFVLAIISAVVLSEIGIFSKWGVTVIAGTEMSSGTYEWSGEYTVSSAISIDQDVTVTDDTIITIEEGKTLTVNGATITVEYDKVLTIAGPGSFKAIGSDGSPAVKGCIMITGGSVNICGGSGCYGIDGEIILEGGTFKIEAGDEGADYSAFSDDTTVSVPEGMYLSEGAHVYSGTLEDNEIDLINDGSTVLYPVYKITLPDSCDNGSVSLDSYYGDCVEDDGVCYFPEDATVYLDIDADSGYCLGTLTVTGDTSGYSYYYEYDEESFIMPDENVTVDAEFISKWQYLQKLLDTENYIELHDDYVATEDDVGLVISGSGRKVTLNLNNYEIDRHLYRHEHDGYVIKVDDGAQLTLTDDIYFAEGEITGGYNSDGGGGVNVTGKGVFIMSGGTIANNYSENDGGGVYVASGGSFEMTGGTIYYNSTDDSGGGVYVASGGNFSLSGGSVYDNGCSGVYVASGGSFTMSGGSIEDNDAHDYGGGVYVAAGGSFTMSSGSIENNDAYYNGGGVYVASGGSFTMSGGSVESNDAYDDGGGVYVASGGSFTMSGGTIKNNFSEGYGDGVYVYDVSSNFVVSGSATVNSNSNDNVYLDYSNDSSYAKITVAGSLSQGTSIGVTTAYVGAAFAIAGKNYNLKEADSCRFSNDEYASLVVMITDDNKKLYFARDISDCTISDISEMEYQGGSEIKPEITVNDSEYGVLSENEHYTVSYSNNADVGIATVTVTGIFNDSGMSYYGTKDKEFYITTAALDENFVDQIPVASDITYGDTLADSEITGGKVLGPCGETVEGTWNWECGDTMPSVSDSDNTSYKIRFSPNEYEKYDCEYVTTDITLTVNPRLVKICGITAEDKDYDGTTDVELNYDNVEFDGFLNGYEEGAFASADGRFEDSNAEDNKTVLIENLTLNGVYDNYVIDEENSQTYTTATINTRAITVKPINQEVELGESISEEPSDVQITVGDLVSGHSITSVSLSGDTDNVTDSGTLEVDSVTISDECGCDVTDNYGINTDFAVLTVIQSKIQITVSGIKASDKDYDGNTEATLDLSDVVLQGLADGDKVTVTATGEFVDKNAGTNKTVTISNLTLTGDDADKYKLAFGGNQSSTTADINPIAVKVSGIKAKNKEYDGSKDAELLYNDVIITGKLSDDELEVTATGMFSSENVGTGVSVYISSITLSGEDAGNYVVDEDNSQGTTSACIEQRKIKIHALAQVVEVGGAIVQTTDQVEVSEGTLASGHRIASVTLSADTSEITDSGEIGISKVVIKDQKGTDVSNNYYITSTSGTLTVTKTKITVSGIKASNKDYDGNTEATLDLSDVVLQGLADGDKVTVTARGEFVDKNAGTNKTVTISNLTLTGDDAEKYVLAASGNQSSTTATIRQKAVKVSGITAKNKKYDGSKDVELLYNGVIITGKLSDDELEVTATGTFSSENVGTGVIVYISDITLSGEDEGNYVLATSGQQRETFADIEKAAHDDETVSGNAKYGNTGTINLSAVLLSGGSAVIGSISNQDIFATAPSIANSTLEFTLCNDSKIVNESSTISITVSSDKYEDYTITATLSVSDKEAPVLSAQSIEKTYDGNAVTASDISGTAKVNGTSIKGTWSFRSDAAIKNVSDSGTKTVVFTPDNTDDYVANTTTIKVTINPKAAAVKADDVTITFGDPEPETLFATVTGNVNNDKIEYTVSRAVGDAAGNYTITPSGDADQGNYIVTYKTGTFTIKPVVINVTSITVRGIVALDKDYDGNTKATLDFSNVVLQGLADGDKVTVTATGEFVDKNAGTNKTVTISNLTLTGDDADKYVLAASGNQSSTTASIHQKAVKVSAITAKNKKYDGSKDAELVYNGVIITGKLSDDELEVTATGMFSSENVGTGVTVYISCITLSGEDEGNYVLATNGQQTETSADIEKAAHGDETVSGSVKYGNTGTINLSALLVSGGSAVIDSVSDMDIFATAPSIANSVLEFTLCNDSKIVGESSTLTITVSSDNYEDYTITATLTVSDKEAPVLTAQNIEKTYDGNAVTAADISGTATMDGKEVAGTWSFENGATFTNADDSGAVTVRFTPNDIRNCKTVTTQITVTINRQAVTVKADNKERTTSESDPELTATVTGLVGTDTLEYTISREAGDDAGIYTITPNGEETQGNYMVTYQTGIFTIASDVIEVTSISLDRKTVDVEDGKSVTLTAIVLPSDATEQTVTWTTSDRNVAVVQNGRVSATGVGTAVITAKAGDKTATCTVRVEKLSGSDNTNNSNNADNNTDTNTDTDTNTNTDTDTNTDTGTDTNTNTDTDTNTETDTDTDTDTNTETDTDTNTNNNTNTDELKVEGGSWTNIKNEIANVPEGGRVTIDMGETTTVPETMINEISGKDVDVVFDMGSGVKWTINGKNVDDVNGNIDLGVTVGKSEIPTDVKTNVTGEKYNVEISLNYSGDFGFKATLTIDMREQDAGLFANLFYYNPKTKVMEFVSSGLIKEDGTVDLEFSHASDYTIIVDDHLLGKELNATVGSTGNMKLLWTAQDCVESYKVYQVINGKWVEIGTTKKTAYTVKGLTNNKTYKFMVRAIVKGKLTAKADSLRLKLKVYYKPAPKTTTADGRITLTWNEVPNATKYRIYIVKNGKLVKLKNTKKLTYTVSAKPGKTYKFAVKAYVNGKWTRVENDDIIKVRAK